MHTREYAVGLANPGGVATGEALRTALKVTNPLVAAVIDLNQPAHSELSLPQSAGLAAVTPAGILRAARTQAGSSAASVDGYYAERMSFILRVYVPDPASVPDGVTITLPNLPNPSGITGYDLNLQAVVVSALAGVGNAGQHREQLGAAGVDRSQQRPWGQRAQVVQRRGPGQERLDLRIRAELPCTENGGVYGLAGAAAGGEGDMSCVMTSRSPGSQAVTGWKQTVAPTTLTRAGRGINHEMTLIAQPGQPRPRPR